MAANPDLKDLFAALCDEQAEFIVVDAQAVMILTEPRYTRTSMSGFARLQTTLRASFELCRCLGLRRRTGLVVARSDPTVPRAECDETLC
jgi:hypothetical protein